MTDPTRSTLIKASVLACALLFTCGIVLAMSRDPDAAAMSLLDKHARLASLPSPKIVLIGDSNLTYGVESSVLERDLDKPVVNTGYMGSLGMRFMLNDAAPDLSLIHI